MSDHALDPRTAAPFPIIAAKAVADSQLRKNVRHATDVIQAKRARVVGELPEWQDLRSAGEAIRRHSMATLSENLQRFEANCIQAGGQVHWARNSEEANAIVIRLVTEALHRFEAQPEVLKIKSMTTEEIGLNRALERAGIHPYETDLAELIVQLGKDQPSHLVVPALHKNRQQIREIFRREMGLTDLSDDPIELAGAARLYLRERFLRVPVAVSGANFLLADTGGVCVVESEGNGRMCLTLPKTLITIAGIDKVLPSYSDLDVVLQTLPRSATGERMNPYNSIWTGVREGDGPQEFHVILLDNGRTDVLADEHGRQTLHCIRCGACQNACPVYKQTGGHAYGSVYSGPIGAILTPQLMHLEHAQSLPYASSLCGACYEVCPVKINIPEVLVHLRHEVVLRKSSFAPEAVAMKTAGLLFRSERRFRAAQRLGRITQRVLEREDPTGERWVSWLPGLLGQWTATRDLPGMPSQTFREWWEQRDQKEPRS
ncbi:MAG: LutB/LldF family L-lactate oxidation iron-sulfur protein [Acidobacteriaceae bacterium]|nr:LutB/LldF family L-lactate oxidation iron-sulfur protein [Acidobacteriaceae bacterium]